MNFENWKKLSLAQQLGNIGSEFFRAMSLREKGDEKNSEKSFMETLNLLDLTISDKRWYLRLKEPLRLREVICDLMTGSREYQTKGNNLNQYFLGFAILVRG